MNQKPKTTKTEIPSNDDLETGGNVSDSVIINGDRNVINMGGKKITSDSSKKNPHHRKSRTLNPSTATIVVALIGIVGTIAVALINVYGEGNSTAPSPTPVPATTIVFTATTTPTVAPTDTVPPSEPTLTLAPATNTPVPTFTSIPPIAIGQDWMAGCISSLWKTYPSNVPTVEKGNGCWVEPVYAFSAENGDLDFLSERGSGYAEIHGLFAPLRESGTVTFTVRLRDLNNADLWMGIFAEPDVVSQGLLMIIPNGNVKRRVIVQKNPLTYDTIQGTVMLDQGDGLV